MFPKKDGTGQTSAGKGSQTCWFRRFDREGESMTDPRRSIRRRSRSCGILILRQYCVSRQWQASCYSLAASLVDHW